ncbi:HpcH/HpaI aldolase/citrate lyase family protein [Nonomuraea thailandensis]
MGRHRAPGQPAVPAEPAPDLRRGQPRGPDRPLVRVPTNGGEKAQWHAKQALDLGAYGIVWPHVTSVREAYNAVAACRYPRLPDTPLYEPAGVRGDSPAAAARYWGVSAKEYYARSDVWPLDPDGEILVAIMIESRRGVESLPDILDQVPGIGLVIPGEGDLSQELGVPRQYDHPRVAESKRRILEVCTERGSPSVIPTSRRTTSSRCWTTATGS